MLEVNPLNKGFTGQVVARLTFDKRNMRMHVGDCLEGFDRCGIKVYEIPTTAKETQLSFRFAKGSPPFWWDATCQKFVLAWMADNQTLLEIMYRRRQRKVRPSGRLDV